MRNDEPYDGREVSKNLDEIDQILEEAAGPPDHMLELAPKVTSRRLFFEQMAKDPRIQSGKRQIVGVASPIPVELARGAGYKMYGSTRELIAALRAEVMYKMIRQAHEAELREPGEPATSGIVGTPEW